jgi:hypothetical protein
MNRLVLVLFAASHAACESGPEPFVFHDAFVAVDAPAHAGAGPGGGIIDQLDFAVVGDTRPAAPDDTANYPTDIVRAIWTAVEAETPHPAFAIMTGDYMFATTSRREQVPQLQLYLAGRAQFSGAAYPAYGNHECTGDTTSNCGAGATDGETANYHAYLDQLVAPIGETRPYFVERFAATDGSWSAKLVFIAPNAWNARQAAWLDAVLAQPTTYTFAVRHEASIVTSIAAVATSDAILAKHPLTLLICGHEHTYRHDPAGKQVVIGNGGAPLSTAIDYGYAIVSRQPDASLQVTAYDYASHAMIDQFSIDATGAPR